MLIPSSYFSLLEAYNSIFSSNWVRKALTVNALDTQSRTHTCPLSPVETSGEAAVSSLSLREEEVGSSMPSTSIA